MPAWGKLSAVNKRDRTDLTSHMNVLEMDFEKQLKDRSRQELEHLAAKNIVGGASFKRVFAVFDEEMRKYVDRMIEAQIAAGAMDALAIATEVRGKFDQAFSMAFGLGRTLAGNLDDAHLGRINTDLRQGYSPYLVGIQDRAAAELLRRRRSLRTLDRMSNWARDNRLVALIASAGVIVGFLKSLVEGILWLVEKVRLLFQ